MAAPIKSMEELFLKIFKITVLSIMGLSLVAIVLLLVAAPFQYGQSPQEPAPAQKAPEKQISLDELKAFLIEQEKQRTRKDVAPKPQPGALGGVSRYGEEALRLFRCSLKFGEDTGKLTVEQVRDEQKNAQMREELRARLEQEANGPLRGDIYIKSAEAFTCKALADPSIIALAKEDRPEANKVGPVFRPTLGFHRMAWDKIQAEKQQFEQREQQRVASQRSSEEVRVSLAKAQALGYLIAAASAFALFMILALYLLAAKIENDLRDINEAVRASGLQRAHT